MLANAVVQRPLEMAISVGIIALGVPVYYFWRGTYTGGVVPQPAAPVEQ